jgi:hypothetical protein
MTELAQRALKAFCDTIDATGGLLVDTDGCAVPAGDEDWPDLADAYMLACEALGREQKLTHHQDRGPL